MKKFYYILGSLQAITAIGAIPAGYGLLMDTTGQGVGMSTKLLENSPPQFISSARIIFTTRQRAGSPGWCLPFLYQTQVYRIYRINSGCSRQ